MSGPCQRDDSSPARVLLADPHPIRREGIKRIAEQSRGFVVAGESRNADELIAWIEAADCDVLLLDMALPGPGFAATVDAVRTKRPGLPILAVCVRPSVGLMREAFEKRVGGFLPTDCSTPADVLDAIRTVGEGGVYVARFAVESESDGMDAAMGETDASHACLSGREYQVLCLLVAGKGIKSIGASLDVSPKTVSTYRARILEKLQLTSNADLVRYAVRRGLTG